MIPRGGNYGGAKVATTLDPITHSYPKILNPEPRYYL